MRLRECFDRHGSDKGKWHQYERVYEPIFRPLRFQALRILEVGIWRGAGLAAWLDYFPHADVCGMDTFQRVPPHRISVLDHERVTWWEADSRRVGEYGDFDIVIDDGCHQAAAQLATALNLYPHCKRGYYFIEDVSPDDPDYPLLISALPDTRRHHDLRQFTGRPDSVILQC